MYGSNDATGATVTDSYIVTALAAALRYNGTILIPSNGAVWKVGVCGSGYEIAANGACTCAATTALRPCIGSSVNWGGISGSTCSAGTQTIYLHFE